MLRKCSNRRIYDLIVGYRDSHGWSPTVRELCDMSGIRSTSTMHKRLQTMEFCGMIRAKRGGARAMVPLPEQDWSEDADS